MYVFLPTAQHVTVWIVGCGTTDRKRTLFFGSRLTLNFSWPAAFVAENCCPSSYILLSKRIFVLDTMIKQTMKTTWVGISSSLFMSNWLKRCPVAKPYYMDANLIPMPEFEVPMALLTNSIRIMREVEKSANFIRNDRAKSLPSAEY